MFLSHFVRFQFSHTFAGIKTSSVLQPIHLIQQFLIHWTRIEPFFFLFHLIVFLLAINLSLLFSWETTTLNWLLFCSNTRQRNERRCRCFCAKSFLPFCAPLRGQYRTCFSLCLDANKVFCYFFGTWIRLNERKTWKRSDSTSFVCDSVKDDSKKVPKAILITASMVVALNR